MEITNIEIIVKRFADNYEDFETRINNRLCVYNTLDTEVIGVDLFNDNNDVVAIIKYRMK